MLSEPQQEHHWLQQFVGDWTYEHEAPDHDGESCGWSEGTQSFRSLGGLWIQGEGRGEMPDGSPATMIITLGYDPRQRRYIGTWVGSMMTHLWVYDGSLDDSGKVLTLEAEGPSMAGDGTMAPYRDVIEVKDENYHTLSSYARGEDGEWRRFMLAHYRRKP
jgi:hypothetical protein